MENELKTAAEMSAEAGRNLRLVYHLGKGVYGAPEACEVVDNLTLINDSLAAVLWQLRRGLMASLESGTSTESEDGCSPGSLGSPADRVNDAAVQLQVIRDSVLQVSRSLTHVSGLLAGVAWEPNE